MDIRSPREEGKPAMALPYSVVDNNASEEDERTISSSNDNRTPVNRIVRKKPAAQKLTPWKHQCTELLQALLATEDSKPFRKARDLSDHSDYTAVVEIPLDLTTVKERLASDCYSNPREVTQELDLIFQSALKHYKQGSRTQQQAQRMSKLMWSQMSSIVEGYNSSQIEIEDVDEQAETQADSATSPSNGVNGHYENGGSIEQSPEQSGQDLIDDPNGLDFDVLDDLEEIYEEEVGVVEQPDLGQEVEELEDEEREERVENGDVAAQELEECLNDDIEPEPEENELDYEFSFEDVDDPDLSQFLEINHSYGDDDEDLEFDNEYQDDRDEEEGSLEINMNGDAGTPVRRRSSAVNSDTPPDFSGQNVRDFGAYVQKLVYNRCLYCNQEFDNKAKWLVHNDCYFIRLGVETLNKGGRPFSGSKFNFSCEICSKTVENLAQLRGHMDFHLDKTYACKSCSNETYTVNHMKRHLQTHTGKTAHSCPRCGREFSQKLSLDWHMETHDDIQKSVQCSWSGCPVMFHSRAGMSEHVRKTHKRPALPKKFECVVVGCGKTFRTSRERCLHIASRHPVEAALVTPQMLMQGYSGKRKRVGERIDVVAGQIVAVAPESSGSVVPAAIRGKSKRHSS